MYEEPQAKKSLGQHWLRDTATLAAIADAAELTPQDTVLEIGPGLGTLTAQLLERAGRVIAVEFDQTLAVQLPQRVASPKLTVERSDILTFDLTKLPAGYKVVANIPYYLTSNLVRVLSESSNPPSMAVLLVQKEVAERLAAQPGAMSLLSVTAQWYWEVALDIVVPASLFAPPPKVDSQVVVMRHRPSSPISTEQTKALFRIVKAGFSQRRKTLLNSLSAGLDQGRDATTAWLERAGIAPTARAQTLSIEDWLRLYKNA